MDVQSNHCDIPSVQSYKEAFNGLHAGIRVGGVRSLMPPNKTPVYGVLGSPFAKYISHIPAAPFNTEKCKERLALPFLLAAKREIHNDPLRTTWDMVTGGRGGDNACIVSFL